MARHKVKLHNWIEGILDIVECWFDSVEEALHFAKHNDADQIKVYTEHGQLVYSGSENSSDTYA